MSVNDRCRLCSENLRVNGYIGGSKKIFHKDANEKSIAERLAQLGLKLLNVQQRSYRICVRCFRLIGRLEDTLVTFRRWKKAEEEATSGQSTPTAETSLSAEASVTQTRDRVPTPPKVRPPSRPASPLPAHTLQKLTAENKARQSVTEVIVYYPSRPKGDRIVCQDNTASIVEAIAKNNWSRAAKMLTRHKELFGPLSENILQIIEEECKKICSPATDFMLSKSSAEDLKTFSLKKLQADLQRVSPFLFSIFLCVSKQAANTACAAAAIALRGREPRLSAFSHCVNTVLRYAGVRKAAFKRLCKLGITTTYSNAVKKHMELANAYGENFQRLKVANKIFFKEKDEDTSTSSDGSDPGSGNGGAEGATRTSTPDVPVGDLDEAEHDMLYLSAVRKEEQEWPSSLDQEDPKPPHIKEEQEELWSSQEGEDTPNFPFTVVSVKSEDEDSAQSFELHEAPPACSSAQQMETETDSSHMLPSSETEDSNDDWKDTTEQEPDQDMSHNQERPFSCTFCDKRFGCKGNLHAHMRSHTGEKPFTCTVCDKSFSAKVNLKTHMRSHTGEKPYSCSLCDKSFSQKKTLVVHLRSHTGEKPFSCSFCGKCFTEKGTLNRHIRVHTGEKPYSCSVCGRTFTLLSHVKSHKCAGESEDK